MQLADQLRFLPGAALKGGSAPCVSEMLERLFHGGVTLEEATRARAYQLWERAGRPHCDGIEFWLEAEAELTCRRRDVA